MHHMGREHSDTALSTTELAMRLDAMHLDAAHLEIKDEGTFLFPPAKYESMASYAKFWSNVPISDGVLANITVGYADLVRRQADSSGSTWGHRYDAVNEKALHHSNDTKKTAAVEARDVAYYAHMAAFYEEHPVRIKADFARAIARAGQACYFASALPLEEMDEIHEATVTVGQEELSIFDVTKRYQLGDIRDYFQNPEVTAAERLEDLRVEIRKMRL